MERIASFSVDHTKLKPGLYLSRTDADDILTWDLRFKTPNAGSYLENPAVHTIEHLFATFVRNSSFGPNIIYFGPMGCLTGFYFITRGMSDAEVLSLVREGFRFIAEYEGVVPGTAIEECGNAAMHDLEGAKKEAREYLQALALCSADRLRYDA